MTSCGFRPRDIDEMTLFDVHALFSYWREFPPAHEILKYAHGISKRPEPSHDDQDPSGIGRLVTLFPDGKIRAS